MVNTSPGEPQLIHEDRKNDLMTKRKTSGFTDGSDKGFGTGSAAIHKHGIQFTTLWCSSNGYPNQEAHESQSTVAER
jgi:hypothetical protein